MSTPSRFLGVPLNLDAKQAATLTLTCDLIGMALGAALTGKVNTGPLVRDMIDLGGQAMAHPNSYTPPRP